MNTLEWKPLTLATLEMACLCLKAIDCDDVLQDADVLDDVRLYPGSIEAFACAVLNDPPGTDLMPVRKALAFGEVLFEEFFTRLNSEFQQAQRRMQRIWERYGVPAHEDKYSVPPHFARALARRGPLVYRAMWFEWLIQDVFVFLALENLNYVDDKAKLARNGQY